MATAKIKLGADVSAAIRDWKSALKQTRTELRQLESQIARTVKAGGPVAAETWAKHAELTQRASFYANRQRVGGSILPARSSMTGSSVLSAKHERKMMKMFAAGMVAEQFAPDWSTPVMMLGYKVHPIESWKESARPSRSYMRAGDKHYINGQQVSPQRAALERKQYGLRDAAGRQSYQTGSTGQRMGTFLGSMATGVSSFAILQTIMAGVNNLSSGRKADEQGRKHQDQIGNEKYQAYLRQALKYQIRGAGRAWHEHLGDILTGENAKVEQQQIVAKYIGLEKTALTDSSAFALAYKKYQPVTTEKGITRQIMDLPGEEMQKVLDTFQKWSEKQEYKSPYQKTSDQYEERRSQMHAHALMTKYTKEAQGWGF